MNALVAGIRAAAWWMVPVVLLACAIGWETDWGRAVRKPLPADEPIAPKPVETALLPEYTIAGGVGARTETTSRTLFNPTRRPAPAVADASRGRLQRGQFALTGTAVVEGKSTAFLRETTGGKSRRVQQGETINGVLVAEVKPDRVRLTLGDESEDLILKVATNPRPTPQPTPAPTAPGAPAAPTTAAAPVTPAGQAAPTPAAVPQGIPQSLAERRRAARAAAGDAAAAGATPPTGAAAPVAPVAPTAPTVPTAAPGTLDPRWGEMDQRYRDAAPKRGNVR